VREKGMGVHLADIIIIIIYRCIKKIIIISDRDNLQRNK